MTEFVRPILAPESIRIAIIDFDGTLSLIRAGWLDIMVDQMVDILQPLPGTTESDADLTEYITDFVLNLNGRPTIYQMDYLVNEIRQRGGLPDTPEYYKQQFLDALHRKSRLRMEAVASGRLTADDLLVPGSRSMLTDLVLRGVQLTLASGTAVADVRNEAELLGIADFFEDRIYGPGDDPREFSKLAVMQQALADTQSTGSHLLGFGDGFVEIENVKQLGGIAIGCATDEEQRSGKVEQWKRTRLIQAGADVIIPDYNDWPRVAERLFGPSGETGGSSVI